MLQDQVTFRPKSSGHSHSLLKRQGSTDAAGPPAKLLNTIVS